MLGTEVGDCEIKSVSFNGDDVCIKFLDPNTCSYFIVRFCGVEAFLMVTGHLQNVSERIHVISPNKANELYLIPQHLLSSLNPTVENLKSEYIYYIEPITGGDVLIACESVKIEH